MEDRQWGSILGALTGGAGGAALGNALGSAAGILTSSTFDQPTLIYHFACIASKIYSQVRLLEVTETLEELEELWLELLEVELLEPLPAMPWKILCLVKNSLVLTS